MTWVAGVDGFRSEWCVVLRNLADDKRDEAVVSSFAELLHMPQRPQFIAVDIPIGLPDVTLGGGRSCDRLAREKIGPQRGRSVFSPPGLLALKQIRRTEAHRAHVAAGGIGIGAQTWALAGKLREVHDVIRREHQRTVREVHPEVSFCAMAGRRLMHSKLTSEGQQERVTILVSVGFPRHYVESNPPKLERVKRDDFLDACAALWTAERMASNAARRLPDVAEELDNLDTAIWY